MGRTSRNGYLTSPRWEARFGQRPTRGYLETWVQDRVRPDSVQVPGGMLPHCGCPPLSLAWLSHGLLLAGHRARGGSKGVCPARSSSALLAGDSPGEPEEEHMG